MIIRDEPKTPTKLTIDEFLGIREDNIFSYIRK